MHVLRTFAEGRGPIGIQHVHVGRFSIVESTQTERQLAPAEIGFVNVGGAGMLCHQSTQGDDGILQLTRLFLRPCELIKHLLFVGRIRIQGQLLLVTRNHGLEIRGSGLVGLGGGLARTLQLQIRQSTQRLGPLCRRHTIGVQQLPVYLGRLAIGHHIDVIGRDGDHLR